jgi:uncharacterized UPF0160 family protein
LLISNKPITYAHHQKQFQKKLTNELVITLIASGLAWKRRALYGHKPKTQAFISLILNKKE